VRWINGLLVILLLTSAGKLWGQDCTVTGTAINFGSYDTFAASPLDADGDIGITCKESIAYTIRLDPGQKLDGGFNPRKMRSSNGYILNYNLYIDTARTKIWGNGTGSTITQSGVGTGKRELFTVYGRIPGRQNVAVGAYSDRISITVEW